MTKTKRPHNGTPPTTPKNGKRARIGELPVNRTFSFERNGKKLNDELLSLKNEGEKIKMRIENLEEQPNSSVPELKREIQYLKTNLIKLLTIYDQLITKVQHQHTDIEDLKERNNQLSSQVDRLESAIKHLELGQMMTIFERNASKFILQPNIGVGNFGGLRYMLDFFDGKKGGKKKEKNKKKQNNKKKDDSIRKQLLGRWEDFQSSNNMEWTEVHWNAISEIKVIRNQEAHPGPIDYTRAKQQITELFVHWETELVDIVNMAVKLNCLLVLGLFANGLQEALVSFVLPEKTKINIPALISCLQDNTSTEEGKAAIARWDKLAQGKKWTTNHEKTLQKLKELKRDECILQEINFDDAKKQVADYVPKEFKQQCFEIIDIMKNIPRDIWVKKEIVGEKFFSDAYQ